MGGRRWERHAAYLASRGWDVDVIARDLAPQGITDAALLRALPENVIIYSVREYEPLIARAGRIAFDIKRRVTPKRSSATGPLVDTGALRWTSSRGISRAHAALVHIARETQWANEVIRLGRGLAASERYDIVASSGPPHMAHEAARAIAVGAGLPLVIDLRDPWGGWKRVPEDYASPLWFAHAKRYERRAALGARLIVMNTDLARDDMRARYPSVAGRIVTIRNGGDDDAIPVVPDDRRFRIRFAGTIYLDRDPRLVFRAAASVVRRLGLTPDDFQLEFMGEVNEFGGRSLLAIAAEEGLDGFVAVEGRRPRSEAMRFLAGGSMLLSLPQDADLCVPAKIFEYTKFNAWILILATAGSATAGVFAGSGADVVDPADIDRMAAVISARYADFRRGGRREPIGDDGRFDRKLQAELLAQHLDAISPVRGGPVQDEARVSVR